MRVPEMERNVSMSKRADGRNDKNNMEITAGCDIAEDTAKKSEAQAGAQEENACGDVHEAIGDENGASHEQLYQNIKE